MVQPELPIEGVHFILSNGLAGSQVWAETPSSTVVTLCLGDTGEAAV